MDFRIAVKAFIVKDERLLIIKRRSNDSHKPGVWDLPGGRLEPGEDPREGLKRETHEETGIDVEILNVMSVRHFIRDDDQTITMLVFLCKPLNDTVQISQEHTDYKWVKIESCKEKLIEYFHAEVDLYHDLGLERFV